jgi:hypothetical protein
MGRVGDGGFEQPDELVPLQLKVTLTDLALLILTLHVATLEAVASGSSRSGRRSPQYAWPRVADPTHAT